MDYQPQEMTMADKLPLGVHRLSDESVETLKRAAQRGAEIAARHIKRPS